MKVYKMFDLHKDGTLGPLYVNRADRMPLNEWLEAKMGPAADETHVKSKLGNLSSKHPGFHCTTVPFSDWIGKKQDGQLVRRVNNVWCECEIKGKEVKPDWFHIPEGYYYFKTNSKQKDPWIIAKYLKINRILSNDEVDRLCLEKGIQPQPMERESA